jgi:hypothetical protein
LVQLHFLLFLVRIQPFQVLLLLFQAVALLRSFQVESLARICHFWKL